MMPLYQAVAHGCRAGLHQETVEEIYWARILRQTEHFSWKRLGSFGADLVVVSGFFERSWDRLSKNLNKAAQSFLLNQTGVYLRAHGRLLEATVAMRTSLEATSGEDRENASKAATNLSELHQTLGDLSQAVAFAQKGVDLADLSEDGGTAIAARTALADTHHQRGDVSQARYLFQEAEQMQKEFEPQYTLLYALQGFQYCDFLLRECPLLTLSPQTLTTSSRHEALSRCCQVRDRAAQTLAWAEKVGLSLFTLALDHLTLGRTFLLEATLDAPFSDMLSPAELHLDRAVTGLRQAGTQHEIPRGLIVRAQLYRFQFEHTNDESFAHKSQQDLDEASQIASRGPMPLFQADIALEQSRLYRAQGHLDQARQSLSEARALIQKHAYHRRDPELEAMEKILGEGT